jgi:hypothetical protein
MVFVATEASPQTPIAFRSPVRRDNGSFVEFAPDEALTESFLAAMAGFNFLELGEDGKDPIAPYSPPGSDISTTADSYVEANSWESFHRRESATSRDSFFCRTAEHVDHRGDAWHGTEHFQLYGKGPGANDKHLSENSGGLKQFKHQFKEDLKDSERDTRTTLMIRNVPRKYTQHQLLVDLTAAYDFSGGADFFYLPTDLGTCRNLGYCFLNLTTPEQAAAVKSALHKRRLSSCAKSGLSIGYADFQGLDANVRNVRRSLMHRIKNRDYRPLLADEKGNLVPITN